MITEAGLKAALKNAARDGKASIELSDGGARGDGRLVLLIKVVGDAQSMQWYAVWWRSDRRRSAKLGSYPTLSIADARKLFREDFAPKISAGEDPLGARSRRNRQGVTVNDLFKGYVEHLKGGDQFSFIQAEYTLLGDRGAAKALGKTKRAADVRPVDIRSHLATIHQRGAASMADKVRSQLHAAFNWAMKSANTYTSAVGSVDWGIEHNPVSAVPSDPAAKRVGERHLLPSELRRFWDWLAASRSRLAPVLQLQICTGQRMTEMLRLGPYAFDRAEKMLDWSKTKNGMPHSIPVSQRSIDILETLPVMAGGLYFPNDVKIESTAAISSVWRIVHGFLEENPDIPRFSPRDLRRTWKTLAGAAGLSKDIRDRLQNHAKADISSRHYDRYSYLTEKRAAVATWDAYLTRILAGELDNPVVELRVAAE